MFATLAAWSGVAVVTGRREPVSSSTINQVLEKVGVQVNGSSQSVAKGSTLGQTNMGPNQYLLHHGFTQWMSYQPASRFWPFQWIEGGWLLVLSLLFMGTAVWLVHRRAV